MLAQPGRHVVVAAVAIVVEDHHHRPHFAVDLMQIAHEDLALVPVADGFAQVDAVEQRSGERLDRGALFRQHALALLLQKPAEILNDDVFRRIGTDAGAVQFDGPFAGNLFLLAALQAQVAHAALRARQASAQPNALGIEPDFVARNVDGLDVACGLLRGVARGRFPNVPARSSHRQSSAPQSSDRRATPSGR